VLVSADHLSPPERKAIEMLRDEVERRTGIRWEHTSRKPSGSGPAIIVGQPADVKPLLPQATAPPTPPESFQTGIVDRQVYINGRDPRGVLYGVGHLLRKLEMRRGQVLLASGYGIATSPETGLRGHQLGYRPKTNSYDGWTLEMWEQYIRDLAVFGINAVELIPPRSDDDADSPHFPKPPMETMIGMSRILDSYGLEVWIWYPALDEDYSRPETVEFALKEWGEVFRKLTRVDAVLVPAGDPGHTPANVLMPMIEKQTANLRKYHPKAQMWLAPQGFDAASIEHFFKVANSKPAWLSGIVYGPQTRISLEELRQRLRKDLPIRHYPDITHTRTSQYPVPDWDTAFAITEAREPVNPRPLDQAQIYRLLRRHTIGFIAYSEGCNDDVNKAIWSGLGWKQDTPVIDILRDYSRYFISPDVAEDFAQGLLALERNWRGPVLTNVGIQVTLSQFQTMERAAPPPLIANWRFQQALYRAYYDAYVQSRLLYETALEDQANQRLRAAKETGSLAAMQMAETILDRALSQPASASLRARVFELAEALYQSIRMQLSVDRYQAIAVGRGANLDTLDVPLNSRVWLKQQFDRIRKIGEESERLREIARIVHWTDPGPGGFYDDLGNPQNQKHLVPGVGFAEDPQFFRGPLVFFDNRQTGRKSWWDHAITFYEQPLRMKYADLDPSARYKVRVVYGAGPLRLRADGSHQIHDYVQRPYEVLEYEVPAETTHDGVLTLEWNRPPGGGGAGRGCQVAEVWLIKLR
jgi:hypothetical protein